MIPYDHHWPALFERLRDEIGDTLAGIPFEAHHIGSTAVPGLCAKPKIDIDVVLQSAADIARSVDLLKTTDRTYHGCPYDDGMWTFTSRRGLSPGHRLYVCAADTATHRKRVLFRDYLRTHPEVAAAYGALKRDLVVGSGGDWDIYTNGKSGFVADVVELARRANPDRA